MAKRKQLGSRAAVALTKDQVFYIMDEFEQDGDVRMSLIVALEYQGPLRIGDVLSITKKQVYLQDGQIRENIDIWEQKTGKRKKIFVYDRNSRERGRLYNLLNEYRPKLNNLPNNSVLFFGNKFTPLTARGVNSKLNKFVGKRNIEQCSSHSIRKACATDLMLNHHVDIERVRDLMNHADTKTTRRYLNINDEQKIAIQKMAAL